MVRLSMLFALVCGLSSAAVIEGVVLDEETGYPLARAQVNMLPIDGAAGAAVSLKSGDRGSFSILSVKPGWYVLRVTRAGFEPAEAGQLRAGRPGAPFEVLNEDRASFFQIRMKRLPAVTGTVLDENGIGIAEWPVHIYTAHKPIRHVAETKTDDRGNFRIGGLAASTYIVRTAAGSLDEDYSLLPTYHKFGTALENAERVRVHLGEVVGDVTVRPVRGRLLTISGTFNVPADRSGRLSLVTDTGRRVIATASGPSNTTVPFQDSSVPPGPVELIAEGFECGGYARLTVDHDRDGIRVGCTPLSRLRIQWQVDGRYSTVQFPVFVRRADLDGVGAAKAVRRDEALAPGHWEVMAQTGSSHYTMEITDGRLSEDAGDGWFGVDIGTNPYLLVRLSSHPAAVSGAVSTAGRPVTGAVVYLESYDPDKNNARLRLWSTRTDLQGNYAFGGLKPAKYRVLSSYDFDVEDPSGMERGAAFALKDGDQAAQNVEMLLP